MVSNQQTLMTLPANQLLDKFGAGSHKPGSGSAAALMGILAGKLIITVGKLSLDRPKYARDHSKIQYIIDLIEKDIEPELLKLFDQDAEIFDEVIKARVARDNAVTDKEKRKFGEQAAEKLREATEIPIRICDFCILLIDHGVAMFDMGFEAARGDSGAGVSAAVAGAMSSVFVINLNLKSFRGSEWAKSRRKRVNDLQKMLEEKQFQAFGRVSQLKEEDVESMTLDI